MKANTLSHKLRSSKIPKLTLLDDPISLIPIPRT